MIKDKLFFDTDIPLSVDLLKINESYSFWSEKLKIIYILKGEYEMYFNSNNFKLSKDKFVILNSYTEYTFINCSESKGMVLELSLNSAYIEKLYMGFSQFIFSLGIDSNKKTSNKLKKYIAELTYNILEKNKTTQNLVLYELVLKLCTFMISNYKVKNESNNKSSLKNKYLIDIMNFLEKNYKNEHLNIDQISNYINLTPQYTLKLFRKYYKIGLMDYLNNMRIKKSLKDLLQSSMSIIEIAIENGFNNSKTYHRVFKKIYNITPGNYRKKHSIHKKNVLIEEDYKKYFSLLYAYLPQNYIDMKEEKIVKVEVDLSTTKTKPLIHYWKKTLALGKAFEGLKGEVQELIKEISSEIDFEYIRINCIFNDELYIYNEDNKGEAFYNYAYIDKLLDFFIKLNLKPFINIGFMPKLLKSNEQYVLSSNVSYPKNIKKWKDLIKNLFIHIKEKYGDQVFEWKFEIWNNPISSNYWYESENDFFKFFKETFFTIKEVSLEFKVGNAPFIAYTNMKYLEKFINFLLKDNISIDFFSINNFTMNNKDFNISSSKKWHFQFYDYKTMKNIINNLNNKIRSLYKKDIELIISEWNSSAYYQDLVHDTCYMSTFIIDTITNNFNTVDNLTYWTSAETRIGRGIFFGGLGLFTINNLKKASYNAFSLLNKIGKNFIDKGENYFITSTKKTYQILLYNYVHYKEEYEKGNFDIIHSKNRYNAFQDKLPKKLLLDLKNLKEGNYLIKKYYLNRQNGSVYDAWIDMGAPEEITEEIFDYLKAKEKMKLEIEKVYLESELLLKETLASHEVVLWEIKYIDTKK